MTIENRQWFRLLDDLDRLARLIRIQSVVVRAQAVETAAARLAGAGFPTTSSPFGERGALHAPQIDRDGNVTDPDPLDLPPAHSDITGELATAIADGTLTADLLSRRRRAAELLTGEAVERLQEAYNAFLAAVPAPAQPEAGRELCASCGGAKDVLTEYGRKPKEWVVAEGRCASCVRRRNRYGLSDSNAS